jgi:diadenylate cyclase
MLSYFITWHRLFLFTYHNHQMLPYKLGFLDITWADLLDMALVALLLYQVYMLVKGSLASRVFLGYLLLYVFYLIVRAIGLELLTKILEYFMGVGAIALIVIFQQEIRRFLLYIGKSTAFANNHLFGFFFKNQRQNTQAEGLKTVVESVKMLAAEFSGALIVLKKNDEIDTYIETGEVLDALLSKRLLVSILHEYSPLHEGAVVIANGRVQAAHCILPVSDSDGYGGLGFRHRAALGMSEATDALVVVVSEETGRVALAIEGDLIQNIQLNELEERLTKYLLQN